MSKISISLASLLLLSTSSAFAQAPAEAAPASAPAPSETTPASDAPAAPTPAPEAPAPTSEAVAPPPEESIDPALLGAADGQLSAEELEKLGFGGGGSESVVDTSLKFFGFADFSFAMAPMKDSNAWKKFVGTHSTFYVGNFNLFLSKNLSENVRTMGEVRFMYAPHGSNNQDGSFNVAQATDPADFNRSIHWGGISIERLYLEWTVHPYLTIRAGQFLTPYGIWNVDHGSPLFIPVQRPYVIGTRLFPERQTGFELYGKWDASTNSAIGYHLTLSNGMGPVTEVKDLDDNKAVGGRVYWELRKLGELRIGGSAFYGQDTAATTLRGLAADGTLTMQEKITSQSDVLSLAADAQWKYKGLHLQFEGITQQRKYTDRGRYGASNPLVGGQTLFPKDTLSWGVYGIAGYRFDWLGVMPYVMMQTFRQTDATSMTTYTRGVTSGLNIRPIDSVVLKLEYAFAVFPDGNLISKNDNIHLLQAQIAWAF